MRYFFFLLLFSAHAFGQLVNTVELNEKLNAKTDEDARMELLHQASMKSIEKFAPDLGYKFEDFQTKLNQKFEEAYKRFEERKLKEKFGATYQTTLTAPEKEQFLETLKLVKHAAFIKFSQSMSLLKSHQISSFIKDPKATDTWSAKITVDLDKIKLEKLLKKTIDTHSKPISKIYLISEIDPIQFGWADLDVTSGRSFLKPLNDSWIKWFGEHTPATVDEVVECDPDCLAFYSQWSDTQVDNLSIPEEYLRAIFLKVNLQLKRESFSLSMKESRYSWEGRAMLLDIGTKRNLASSDLSQENRTFRQMDQKALNSGLASSLYRTPISAFMQFNQKMETTGFTSTSPVRVSRLVIKGHKHLGDVLALENALKARGSSLGLEVYLDHFTKNEANLICYYRGEEKSFTDLLSAIKELKSSHRYTVVNEFTGIHHVLKLITE